MRVENLIAIPVDMVLLNSRSWARRYVAAVLCALIPFSVGGASSIDWTLCLADDGHATLELAHGDSECWTDVRRHHDGPGALETSELDHHTCNDIPIIDGREGHASSKRFAVAVVGEVVRRRDPIAGARAGGALGAAAGFTIERTLRIRRSVVLIV